MTSRSPRHLAWVLLLAVSLAALGCPATDDDDTSGDDDSTSDDDSSSDDDTDDPCEGFEELLVSITAADQADATLEGSAAALMAGVPAGCETVLRFAEEGAYTVGTDMDFPSWTTLRMSTGAWLDLQAGVTVRVDGGIEAGRTRIFGDDGIVVGSPLVDEVWPEWFGALPDDDLDDAPALQRALDLSSPVTLLAAAYDVHGTVTLPDGAHLRGSKTGTSSLRSALVHPASGGFHPTRVLQANGVSGLTLGDLVIDGNRHAHEEECWDYPETDNLARFEEVEGLVMERVQITAWEANWGIEDQSFAHALAVVGSRDVQLVDVSYTDSRTEGLLFQDCEDVHIEGLYTQNTDTWTPLNAFYVDGFTLVDSTIIEDEGIEWTGSTANLTIRNGTIRNNSFTGGWGLDLGDELGDTIYGPGDITIEDNSIETVGACIYFSPFASGDQVSQVQILGNDLTLHRAESADDTDRMIRVDASDDVLIEDNTFTVPDSGSGLTLGISFAASTEGIVIQDNTLSGVDTGIAHSGDSPLGGDLSIVDNSITCASEIRRNSWQGGSTGVWIFYYQQAHFDSILVERNLIEAHGGWVSLIDYRTLSEENPPPFVDQLVVVDNEFLPEAGSERNVTAEGAASATIEGNTPDWVNPPS